jgi:tetratricopeptide (TPR) repeat protein
VIRLDADGRAWPRQDRFGEAALAALDPATRIGIHRRLAATADDPAVRAVHLAEAGDHAAAAAAARDAQVHAPSRWSYASFLMLEARHARPEDPRVSVDAAEALSLVGRYEDAMACLPAAAPSDELDVRAALVTARSAWSLTDIPRARSAIERVLERTDAPDAARSEMLTIRSRILARTDWDIEGAIRDGNDALALAGDDARLRAAAYSALGLARLVVADPGWSDDLEAAARLAVDDVDVHEAVTIHDAAIFGHLLNGDPARSLALAQEMVAFTEPVSAAWNGYFRAVALLVTMHVTGDHGAVRAEADVLGRRPLSVRAGETRRTALVLARLDGGDELGALDLAESALELASDDTARAMASWMLAESAWLVGDADRALAIARSTLDLPMAGYPACVNAALIGIRAARDLGLDAPPELVAATVSGFPNLGAARMEADALTRSAPADAAVGFAAAADAWWRISRRAALRARWSEAVAWADAGRGDDARRVVEELRHLGAAAAIPWLDRRIDAVGRRLGLHTRSAASASLVMARVVRGHPTPVIARGLCLGRSTVDGHVRDAIERTGARTRLEAALVLTAEGRDRAAPRSYAVRGGAGGWTVRSLDVEPQERRTELPRMPLHFQGEVALTGTVADGPGVERALLAAARGAGLDLYVTDAAALAALADGLARLGTVVRAPGDPAPAPVGVELDDVDRGLVAALAAGSTVTQAAAAAGYSRRQAQRRLVELRARTGSATNAEMVAALTQDVPH